MQALVKNLFVETQQAAASLVANEALHAAVAEAGSALARALQAGGRVYACGNGGSMCDAMHFAEELSGRYRKDRAPLAAAAISDVGHMTCVSNDYGYEHVFSRWVEAHGRIGDVLVGISTSGSSCSILNAARVAREKGMVVIGMHGRPGSDLAKLAHHDICTPSGRYADRVQECHIKVVHILIELVERTLFPANYLETAENSSVVGAA